MSYSLVSALQRSLIENCLSDGSVWLVGKQEIETFAPFDAADFETSTTDYIGLASLMQLAGGDLSASGAAR